MVATFPTGVAAAILLTAHLIMPILAPFALPRGRRGAVLVTLVTSWRRDSGEGVLVGLLADGEQCKLLKLHKAGDGAVDDG